MKGMTGGPGLFNIPHLLLELEEGMYYMEIDMGLRPYLRNLLLEVKVLARPRV